MNSPRFFDELLQRSLSDADRKGCMLVNSALEMAPHDPEFRTAVANALTRIEDFFLERIRAGQAAGAICAARPAEELARHLLGVLMGLRVLARVRPERALLTGVVAPSMALLDPRGRAG